MVEREKSEIKSNVTGYSQKNGVSRQTLYTLLWQFKCRFAENKSGAKRKIKMEEWNELEQELEQKTQENKRLQKELMNQQQKKVSHVRIVRTILEGAVSPMSAKNIKRLLWESLSVRWSKSKIKGIIAEYSTKAKELLRKMGAEKLVEFMAIDEIFSGKKPILTGVDLKSFAVLLCEKAESRSADVWKSALKLFPCLKLVASDRAKGIIKAVSECKLEHQFDLFHFKRDCGRFLRNWESQAYKKIEAEYKAQKRAEKRQTDSSLSSYLSCKAQADEWIEKFDQAEHAIHTIYDSLLVFTNDGNLLAPEKSLKKLQLGANLLRRLGSGEKIENLLKQMDDPRLYLFLAQLHDSLQSFVIRWQPNVPTMLRPQVIKILSHHWFLVQQQAKQKTLKLQQTLIASSLQVRQLQLALANFNEVKDTIFLALDRTFRASSLCESFNSHVRICQQVKKGIHADFPALLALKWNATPFEQGKRKGKSPYQLLGLTKHGSWLDLLFA